MKAKILGIALLTIMVLGLQAQPNEQRGMRPSPNRSDQSQMNRGPEALIKALNLTQDQQDALKKIRLSTSKELTPLRMALGESTAHLKTLTSVDKPDMEAINKSLEKIGAQKVEIAKTSLKYALQMRSLLTDEQRLKLESMKARLKQMKARGTGRNGMGLGL